jgi:3-deoxy-manno-octulosonate cytidylyltransferase (CMP-KDO synthetase)
LKYRIIFGEQKKYSSQSIEMKNILAIIPARFASTRFPGKPLIDIKGQPMVWQVYLRAMEAGLENIYVATDDMRIFEAIESRGGNALLTASSHLSGTDRCGELVQQLKKEGKSFDYVLNLQGDEPFIAPEQIKLLCSGLQRKKITTLVKKIEIPEQLENPNVVKTVWSKVTGYALYFSRFPVPFLRAGTPDIYRHDYYKHIGLYGFDAEILEKLVKLKPSPLELAESLEQLRWLENGYNIKVVETSLETIGIDSPEDLKHLAD